MDVVKVWNGRLACALQAAHRLSNESFAERLGIGVRTVASWHDKADLVPRPELQQILDSVLDQATESTRSRFNLLRGEKAAPPASAEPVARLVTFQTRAPLTGSDDQPDPEMSRRIFLNEVLAGADTAASSLLAAAENIRTELESTLTAGTVSPSRLDRLEETVADHIRVYATTPPTPALAGLLLDFMDMRRLMAQRQPATIQACLSEMSTLLATLTADSLMKMGRIGEAHDWYCTARIAADDTSNRELRARVRAQEAMLPYYYGHPNEVVRLVGEAREILGDLPRPTAAFASAAEARALSRLGLRNEAEAVLRRAQDLAATTHEQDSNDAFRFGERRLLFYSSSTLSNLGESARALRVQDEALALYGGTAGLIDPALIRLDRAELLAADGDVNEGISLAHDACFSVDPSHRTPIFAARIRQIIETLPPGTEARQILGELRQSLIVPANRL